MYNAWNVFRLYLRPLLTCWEDWPDRILKSRHRGRDPGEEDMSSSALFVLPFPKLSCWHVNKECRPWPIRIGRGSQPRWHLAFFLSLKTKFISGVRLCEKWKRCWSNHWGPPCLMPSHRKEASFFRKWR